MIIGAGGFGTRAAVHLAKKLGDEAVLLADSKDQLAALKNEYNGFDFSGYAVNYGTMGGANRDWRTAMEQARKDKALAKMVADVRKLAREIYPKVPVICWGAGGATGFTTAYYVGREIPYAVHVTTLPDTDNEVDPKMVLQNAVDQLSIIKDELEYHPVIVNKHDVPAEEVGRIVASIMVSRDLTNANRVSNAAFKRVNGNKRRVAYVIENKNVMRQVFLDKLISKLRSIVNKVENGFEDVQLAYDDITRSEKRVKVDNGVFVADDGDDDDFFSQLL